MSYVSIYWGGGCLCLFWSGLLGEIQVCFVIAILLNEGILNIPKFVEIIGILL